jgi:RNA polymerase sigma-70 factor (ECF subfamily)
VRNAIEQLPPVYREVILLREFEELSYSEIANVLDCPTGTVMSRLGRAREKLKEALRHWGWRADSAASGGGES